MAMSVGTGSGQAMCDINTTPLIDVMLVLLVTLIVSLPIQTHAVKLDMPNANNPPPPQDQRPEVIDLEVDFDGTVVYNGNPVPSIDTLEGYFRTEAQKDPQPEIHLRADKETRYEAVGRVMYAIQRGGIVKVGFLTEPDHGVRGAR